ncbi:hypothetical protein [Leptolyngbya sp. FACHB-261]|uniref:hypothetical protein n=1 Tax=Leptolyngbya sp. FACHB-261 TaxID=2692806 RepID=UPI0016861600|nr:hypothetical protein [Leptolyngbya sp. FACHB-261]MBD2102032.1 hypothetical protein [Leptolyngbya sp. FACHB-261]
MNTVLKTAALAAVVTISVATTADWVTASRSPSVEHMLTATLPKDVVDHMLTAEVPSQVRNHMLTAEIPAKIRERMLTAEIPSQVRDHMLTASASPRDNGYYIDLIQRA